MESRFKSELEKMSKLMQAQRDDFTKHMALMQQEAEHNLQMRSMLEAQIEQ